MSKFRVTYPSGLVEETEQSDCDTLEQFVNAKFGSSDYASNGVVVERAQGAGDIVHAGCPQVDEAVQFSHGEAPDSTWLASADAARAEGMESQEEVEALLSPAVKDAEVQSKSQIKRIKAQKA